MQALNSTQTLGTRKTILITGGAGYIGSHAGFELARLGYTILVLDNFRHGHNFNHAWATVIRGDYGNAQLLESIFTTHRVHAVIHCASLIEVRESVTDPLSYYQNNVSNTVTLLRAMQKYSVRKLIFSSSCAVYGMPQQIPITEDHPLNPISPYGRTKLMIEAIMQDTQAAHGIEFVILRYFNAAGAYPEFNLGEFHVPETHLIPLALQAAYQGKPFSIFGTKLATPDGSCVRDFVHVRDIAHAHVRALEHLDRELPSDIFNLGVGSGYSVRAVLDSVQRVTGKKMVILEHPARAGDPSVLVADAGKARDILGWEPRFSELEFMVGSAQVSFLRGVAGGVGERVESGRVSSEKMEIGE